MSARAVTCLIIALAIGSVGALAVLFLFDPATHGFYPQCMLHKVTGFSCPGCGALRATHELLHGNVTKAFSLNPLFVICVPLVIGYGAFGYWRNRQGVPIRAPRVAWVWLGAVVIISFGVLRNVPFGALAQHH